MQEKKKYSIFVDPDVWDRFMHEVSKKWGCTYGAKSLEIELALNKATADLRNGYKKGGHTHTHTNTFSKEGKTKELKEQVEDWLVANKRYDVSLNTVSEIHLKEAIRAIEKVTDRRSVKDRIESLLACGVKRFTSSNGDIRYDFCIKISPSEPSEAMILPLQGDLR